MPDIQMSLIGSPADIVNPLFDGEVKPEGIEITATRADGSTGYWRQFNFNEFDVSSLSVASYIIARTRGYDAVALRCSRRVASCTPSSGTTRTPASASPPI